MDRHAVHDEMERARASFHELLDGASDADLHRRSDGTRWNNKQLLFHMLIGYLIARALRGLVVTFDRLPAVANRRFARSM
ncbi:MAG: DinB family protein [Pseudonocardiaceae bacterium]